MKVQSAGRSFTTSPQKVVRGRQFNTGGSTLEILIALAVLVLSISAATLMAFSNQSVAVDSQTNNEALYKAGAMLEGERALAREDFLSVMTTPTVDEAIGGLIYHKTITVADLTQCKKQATSTIAWNVTPLRSQKIELTTFLTDVSTAILLGGDCTVDPPNSSWKSPDNFNSIDFSPSGIKASGIDVQNKIVFMTGTDPAIAKPDFFVIDARNASTTTPPILSWSLNTGDGLNAVDTVLSSDGNYYAYLASNDVTLSPLKQLIVVRENKDLSTAPVVIASSTLPNMTAGLCPGTQCPTARSIFYYGGRVYIGTQYLANLAAPATKNNEFHVFCVSDPSIPLCSPTNPVWLGSFNVDHNVNAIVVRGNYAYLGTSGNTTALTILNVGNPVAITLASTLSVGGTEDAEVLDMLGNYIYLGKDRSSPASAPDFFAVDVFHPGAPLVKGSVDIPMKSGATIKGLRVNGSLAFIGTTDSNDPFQVWNIGNLSNIYRWDDHIYNFSEKTVGLDYEANRVYTANQSNDALRIIYGP